MHKAALYLALAAVLAACGSKEVKQDVPVTDRSQGVAPTASTGSSGSSTSGVTTTNINADPLASGILLKRSVYFDFDSNAVKDEFRPVVQAHSKYMTADKRDSRIRIEGNTDERGSREYNVGLGQRRSDGVKKMLILLGARENQIESVSLGEEKPQADGHDESAWSKNRRSDILYNGEY